jgi:hypothetical protein
VGGAVAVEPEVAAVTQGLRDLMDRTPRERARLGQVGRALVEENYTWHRQAARLAAVYQWLSGRSAPPESVIT